MSDFKRYQREDAGNLSQSYNFLKGTVGPTKTRIKKRAPEILGTYLKQGPGTAKVIGPREQELQRIGADVANVRSMYEAAGGDGKWGSFEEWLKNGMTGVQSMAVYGGSEW